MPMNWALSYTNSHMEMSFVGVVKSFSFRIESTPTTYECPLIRGSFTLQKRRFKLQSDMYIICNVPSQYIFSTGSGNQKSPCLPPRVQASWVKNQGFSLQRRACHGRLVERTRPRPAPRSEWNFPREFVANGGVVVWIKKGACGTSGGMAIWDVVFLVGGYNRFYSICSMCMFISVFCCFLFNL